MNATPSSLQLVVQTITLILGFSSLLIAVVKGFMWLQKTFGEMVTRVELISKLDKEREDNARMQAAEREALSLQLDEIVSAHREHTSIFNEFAKESRTSREMIHAQLAVQTVEMATVKTKVEGLEREAERWRRQ